MNRKRIIKRVIKEINRELHNLEIRVTRLEAADKRIIHRLTELEINQDEKKGGTMND